MYQEHLRPVDLKNEDHQIGPRSRMTNKKNLAEWHFCSSDNEISCPITIYGQTSGDASQFELKVCCSRFYRRLYLFVRPQIGCGQQELMLGPVFASTTASMRPSSHE